MPNAGSAGAPGTRSAIVPPGVDWWVLAPLLVGFAALYLPTYWTLVQRVWPSDEQGHGPIILAVSGWLLYGKREALAACVARPRILAGIVVLVFGLALYAIGRSQSILLFEVSSQIVVLCALLLFFLGVAALRIVWFPLLFLLFMVPLPATLVIAVTMPLKAAVSSVAASIMYAMGYPIGRSGVVLTVGPYQLLVADACAGLNSMFTLEALGLLYMNLMRYTSVPRNVALALLIIPIAFCANIIRVIILVLVTYHFGDEAGQGFVHGFAGMVLFLVALALILAVDRVLRWILPGGSGPAAQQRGTA